MPGYHPFSKMKGSLEALQVVVYNNIIIICFVFFAHFKVALVSVHKAWKSQYSHERLFSPISGGGGESGEVLTLDWMMTMTMNGLWGETLDPFIIAGCLSRLHSQTMAESFLYKGTWAGHPFHNTFSLFRLKVVKGDVREKFILSSLLFLLI